MAGIMVSVIIPTLNEADHVAASLRSVEAQPGKVETFVVDGGSTDDTRSIAERHAVVVPSERGRAVQMNTGARHAHGEALLFLHADSALHPEALAHVRRTLRDPRIVGGTFTLSFDRDEPLLRVYAFCTRFRFRYFHYGDQGIFVRRSVFERLGGFKEIPLMEDVDFLRRLYRAGRVALLPFPVTTSARRFTRRGAFRQQSLNFLLVSLYAMGANPKTLARWYGITRS